MIRQALFVLAALSDLFVAATAQPSAVPTLAPAPGGCVAVTRFAGSTRDVGPALQACIDATPPGGRIALTPGRYLIATPVTIRRPLTLMTRGLSATSQPCSADERRCATLHLAIAETAVSKAVMPFNVDSNTVRLDHLVFAGMRQTNPRLSASRCASDAHRPMAGGVRITGDGVTIARSTFRDMACYTALEYGSGTDVAITGNEFIGNGTHTVLLGWADGLTIHNATRFRITGNRFRDNTDVQLILGGCTGCTIADNRFRHGTAAVGGSFAELMLQAWPGVTSGDFTGTTTTRNDIDCGPMRRCGFGIMIGSAPWYQAPAFGGMVIANRVRQTMLALDVDRLTGPMMVGPNQLEGTPGTYPTNCGLRRIGTAMNVSPDSRYFLSSALPGASAISYRGCILNYTIGLSPPKASR